MSASYQIQKYDEEAPLRQSNVSIHSSGEESQMIENMEYGEAPQQHNMEKKKSSKTAKALLLSGILLLVGGLIVLILMVCKKGGDLERKTTPIPAGGEFYAPEVEAKLREVIKRETDAGRSPALSEMQADVISQVEKADNKGVYSNQFTHGDLMKNEDFVKYLKEKLTDDYEAIKKLAKEVAVERALNIDTVVLNAAPVLVSVAKGLGKLDNPKWDGANEGVYQFYQEVLAIYAKPENSHIVAFLEAARNLNEVEKDLEYKALNTFSDFANYLVQNESVKAELKKSFASELEVLLSSNMHPEKCLFYLPSFAQHEVVGKALLKAVDEGKKALVDIGLKSDFVYEKAEEISKLYVDIFPNARPLPKDFKEDIGDMLMEYYVKVPRSNADSVREFFFGESKDVKDKAEETLVAKRYEVLKPKKDKAVQLGTELVTQNSNKYQGAVDEVKKNLPELKEPKQTEEIASIGERDVAELAEAALDGHAVELP